MKDSWRTTTEASENRNKREEHSTKASMLYYWLLSSHNRELQRVKKWKRLKKQKTQERSKWSKKRITHRELSIDPSMQSNKATLKPSCSTTYMECSSTYSCYLTHLWPSFITERRLGLSRILWMSSHHCAPNYLTSSACVSCMAFPHKRAAQPAAAPSQQW